MAREVMFVDVDRCVRRFGEQATLISVNDANRPHAVSVLVSIAQEQLVVRVGARTRDNLAERPGLSLLWQPTEGTDYQLIVDGIADHIADADDGLAEVVIAVERGILHRLAGAAGSGPSCIALESA